ncbi:UxaA family hydrolase [Ruminococcaceae bacterium OttesenSCG-928-I18]|nr:UxaA family hydrolase [Ruminococcaceae bacterium OttesenSCG-928-I18]
MHFYGFKRTDGKVGVRNHVLILPTSVCASDTTRIIASQAAGAVTFNNQNGCSQTGPDQQFTMDVMAGFASNPNVYGTVVVSLGCENCQMNLVVDAIRERTDKPLETFIIQEIGGTLKTIELAVRAANTMAEAASSQKREQADISQLILGTKCGGSDPTSGLAANVLLGEVSNRLVAAGGTSILSETPELIGAEHILAARAKTPQVKERIYEIIYRFEDYLRKVVGEEARESNPTLGNIASGITTLEEKSLGCIHKAGSAEIMAVYDYAKPVVDKGLVIMDAAGHDPSCVAALVAGGAQVVIYTTGLGTPLGNPISPVIKITGNRFTHEKMCENIDFECSDLIYGKKTLQQMGAELMEEMLQTVGGKLTRAEALGYMEIAIDRISNYT